MPAVRALYHRADLGVFDSRWPGSTTFPPPPDITHGEDLTADMVGPHPSVTPRPYPGPRTATVNHAWLAAYNLGSKLIVGMGFDAVTLKVTAPGVTFAHCHFHGQPTGQSYVWGTVPAVFVSCLADMRGTVTTTASKQPYKVDGARFSWCLTQGADKMCQVTPHMVIDACMVRWVNEFVEGAHQTCLSAQDPPIHGAVVSRCKLLGRHESDPTDARGMSNCVSCYNNLHHTGLVIEDCYIAGGGHYAIYGGGGNDSGYHAQNLVVRRNVFGRDFARHCSEGTPLFGFSQDPSSRWEDNTWGPPGPYFVAGDPAEGSIVPVAYDTTGTVNLAP